MISFSSASSVSSLSTVFLPQLGFNLVKQFAGVAFDWRIPPRPYNFFNLIIRQPDPLLWWGGVEFQFGAKALVFVKQSPKIRLLLWLWTAMTAPGALKLMVSHRSSPLTCLVQKEHQQ
jgi:hypothetical protein